MSDHNLVSKEVWELNHILDRYGFEQTEKNREMLGEKVDKFKKKSELAPHNRKNFYVFLETNYQNYKDQADKLGLNDK